MPVSRFQKPARLSLRDTFVPQAIPLPFQALQGAITERRRASAEVEGMEDAIGLITQRAIRQDRDEKNEILESYDRRASEIVEEGGNDFDLIRRELRKVAKDIFKDQTRGGKLFDIDVRLKGQERVLKEIEAAKDRGDISDALGDRLFARATRTTPALADLDEQGRVQPFSGVTIAEEIPDISGVMIKGIEKLKPDGSVEGFYIDGKLITEDKFKGLSRSKVFNASYNYGRQQKGIMNSLRQDVSFMSDEELLRGVTGLIDEYEDQLSSLDKGLLDMSEFKLMQKLVDDYDEAENEGLTRSDLEKFHIESILIGESRLSAGILGFTEVSGKEGAITKDVDGGGPRKPVAPLLSTGYNITYPPTSMKTSEDINENIATADDAVAQTQETLALYLKENGITANTRVDDPKGMILNEDGVNVVQPISSLNAAIKQAKRTKQSIIDYRRELEEEAGFGERELEELEADAEKFSQFVLERRIEARKERKEVDVGEFIGTGLPPGMIRGVTFADVADLFRGDFTDEDIKERARRTSLKRDPKWKLYEEAIARAAEDQVMEVGVVEFRKSSTYTSLDRFINNLILSGVSGEQSVDQGGARISFMGTERSGDLTPDDYKKLDIAGGRSLGWFFHPGNDRIEIAIAATNEKGETVAIVSTDAINSVVERIIMEGGVDEGSVAVAQILSKMEDSPESPTGIGKAQDIAGISVTKNTSRDKGLFPGAQFTIRVPTKSGFPKEESFLTKTEAVIRIVEIIYTQAYNDEQREGI